MPAEEILTNGNVAKALAGLCVCASYRAPKTLLNIILMPVSQELKSDLRIIQALHEIQAVYPVEFLRGGEKVEVVEGID